MSVGSAFTAVNVTGTEGQLLLITDDITSGSIFAVNDVSGMPSIDVDATGTIQLAPFGENEFVGIGTTNPTSKLHVIGDTNLAGNLNVSGISTFVGFSTFKNSINVSGVSTFHNELHLHDSLRVFDDDGVLAFGVFPDFPTGSIGGRVVAYQIQVADFLDVNGDLDVDGHTELDNVRISGETTFNDDIFVGVGATVGFGTTAYFKDNVRAVFGDDEDLNIYHSGTQSVIEVTGTGPLKILTGNFNVRNAADNRNICLLYTSPSPRDG